ncbi:ABC transporter ATP-binding protein [Janthinobacterium sp. hw3]|uniref:ABC transporter ATP-binding protein n=1 Tax=Janthinobacterium fluminis TaxID=2987524 RepID=A0ABT5K1F8_9BURK|nr:ABC transporter ATP-binding protein [Janthinobacterium fluminis]MDC8758764.1 ABC transporter ATP-binding protein [Janthinobacterium fluminis]
MQAQELSFGYPGAAPLFEAVSLAVRPREIVCLLGGSGCGKSSLLRVLAGLQAPAGGSIRFLDAPLLQPDPRSALVFQQASLLPWLDVAGNVGFGLDFARQPELGAERHHARVAQAIEAVGLAGRAHLYPAALSGGMAQRVALARALAREPELLFADEPFSALDAITRAEMQTLLVDVVHRWHSAVLLVTHDIDEAILVADRILLMGGRPGRIVREWRVDIAAPRESHGGAVTELKMDILAALLALREPSPSATRPGTHP